MPVISLIALAMVLAPVQIAPGTSAPAGPLPPSLNVLGIQRCNPSSINAAVDCLTGNLDNDDAGDLARQGGVKYLPALTQMMNDKWHLADPASPVAKDMAARGIYYPENAASVLISIMDSRIQGLRVDYKRMSNELKKTARPTAVVAAPPPPGPPTVTQIAPGAGPSMVGAVAVPVEQCKRPNAAPGEIIVSCMKLPSGALVATRRIPNPPKAPN